MIGLQDIINESWIVAVNVGSDGIDGRSKRFPQTDPLLHGSAAGILNTGNCNAALGKFGRGITRAKR